MLTLIIVFIISLILFIYSSIKNMKNTRPDERITIKNALLKIKNNFENIIMGEIAILAITALLICLAEVFIFQYTESKHVHVESTYSHSFEINSLNDNLITNGHIYLRSGYIDEDMYYYFLRDYSSGMKQGKIPADDTFVNITDETPKIEVYTNKQVYTGFLKDFIFNQSHELDDSYKLFIPDDSIDYSYNINLE